MYSKSQRVLHLLLRWLCCFHTCREEIFKVIHKREECVLLLIKINARTRGKTFLATLPAAVAEVESSSSFATLRATNCIVRHPQTMLLVQQKVAPCVRALNVLFCH